MSETTPPPALEALLRQLIDYAGLFPPASLEMGSAVAEYGRQLRGPHAWMLGRFIVPAARLGEFEAEAMDLLPRSEGAAPWPLSVLVGKEPEADREKVESFDTVHAEADAGLARVEALETKLEAPEAVGRVCNLFAGRELYFEIDSARDPQPFLEEIAAHTGRGARAKIRTGGVTPEAIPDRARVARFLAAVAREGAAFKATAGLHHPIRGEHPLTYEPASPSGTMHGFLNLFLAAAFLREGSIDEAEAREMLAERSTSAFELAREEVRWRGRRLVVESIVRTRRDFAISYGSCSFREPVEELQSLGLLS